MSRQPRCELGGLGAPEIIIRNEKRMDLVLSQGGAVGRDRQWLLADASQRRNIALVGPASPPCGRRWGLGMRAYA